MQATTANNFCSNNRTNVDNMAQMSGNGQRLFTELYPVKPPKSSDICSSSTRSLLPLSQLLYLLSVLFSPYRFGHMCLTLPATLGLMWMFTQGWPFYMCALRSCLSPSVNTTSWTPRKTSKTVSFRLPKRNIFRRVRGIDEGASHECKDVPQQTG